MLGVAWTRSAHPEASHPPHPPPLAGTLTPIVSNPEAATMSESTRGVVRRLAELFPSAIVSGRSRLKVQSFVQLAELFYAGSHGMDITGPAPGATAGAATWEDQVAFQPAAAFQPVMATLCEELEEGEFKGGRGQERARRRRHHEMGAGRAGLAGKGWMLQSTVLEPG